MNFHLSLVLICGTLVSAQTFQEQETVLKDYFYSFSDVTDSDGYVDFIVQGDDADYYSITQIFVYNPDNSTISLVENTGIYSLGSQGNIRHFHLNDDNNLDILSFVFDWSSGDYSLLTKVFSNTSTFQNQ